MKTTIDSSKNTLTIRFNAEQEELGKLLLITIDPRAVLFPKLGNSARKKVSTGGTSKYVLKSDSPTVKNILNKRLNYIIIDLDYVPLENDVLVGIMKDVVIK